jgi:hypothetical protein
VGIDSVEAARRGQGSKAAQKRHPYAAIEHRILDSAAWADLSFSARALLIQIARKLTAPNNNGQLEVAYSYVARFGYSEATIWRGLADLVSHGFLFRTKSGGYNRGTSRFAVTWLKLGDNRDGISPQGFKMYAWRDWQPTEKKRTSKIKTHSFKKEELPAPIASILRCEPSLKIEDSEQYQCTATNMMPPPDYGAWILGYLTRLAAHGQQFLDACSVEPTPCL